MFREQQTFALSCRDEDQAPPVRAGVQAVGRLDGVLFELTLRQTYRNFPLKLEIAFDTREGLGVCYNRAISRLSGAEDEIGK